ncbi:MAG: hypothetical protein CL831_03135, partial [Crocinitomicaceae bacterium]|nr:hypothetical protein [Crocinitomicaceae bacterium]
DSNACNYASGATDNDGSCDFTSCLGCTSPFACNYDTSASIDDGSCDFTSCIVFGCADSNACNYDPLADYDNGSCTYANFPYNCDGSCINDNNNDGVCDEFETFGCTDSSACNYSSGATDDDGSCTYDCSGCTDPSACNFDSTASIDDESCEFTSCNVIGCTDPIACNYNSEAEYDDASCSYIPEGDCDCDGNVLDECGTCGGAGIPEGECDCDGNVLDECGTCGGSGIPEGDCDCDGNVLDECGTCGGSGIPEGDCDCDGNQLDALGVCGGDCEADTDGDGICNDDEVPGCQDDTACNFNIFATDSEFCIYPEGICETCSGQNDGTGTVVNNDSDGDGVCDQDEVPGCQDDTACNYNVIATDSDNSCIYTEGICETCSGENDGTGTVVNNDGDGDGICDDVDDCFGSYDECGSCNGPGAIYECGCSDIPEGDCDCDGNALDALGECGGPCEADADADGLCDDVDDCVGEYDECGVCNGFGAVYDCGCSGIPEGDCDCDGNVDDVVGVCGGTCEADVNQNNICDTEEYGCTDADNPNYDPTAAFDDGSCIDGGCTFPAACNYDSNADYQLLGSCDFTSCAGCTNEDACNYDTTSTIDDGSCVFAPFGYDCEGSCLNDDDGDGICNEFEVLGCTETGNPNFNPYATDDDGSCLTGGCNIPAACNFNPAADYLIASTCDFESCIGCADLAACNYDANALIPDLTLCEYPLNIFIDCNGVCNNDSDNDGICDENEIPGCTDPTASNYNPEATNDNGTCQAALVGGCILPFACNYNPEANYYLPGSCEFGPCGGMPPMDLCTQAEACNYGSEGPCEYMSCLSLGCNVTGACNYDETSQYNDGSCEYLSCLGCRNPLACDYDPEATIDGACYDFNTCIGCLDSNANNYDPEATQGGETCLFEGCVIQEACNFDENANSNDGSCEFNSCSGCLNDIACNYEPEAFISGDCSFAPVGFDCEGNGTQGGCTDSCACNFDSNANAEDETCDYGCLGCIYPTAENYNEAASRDDGSCIFVGCLDEDYANYNPVANSTSECSHAPASADFNGDGSVQISDLTTFLQAFSQIGPEWGGLEWVIESCEVDAYADADILAWMLGIASTPEVNTCGMAGCGYLGAINYNPEATFDTGSCVFAGCTDVEAFNFDRLAIVDNGSCNYSVCPDFNGDGEVQISDLMDFLIQWGNIE